MLKCRFKTEVLENNGHRKEVVNVRFDKEHKMLEEFFNTEVRSFKMAVYAVLNEIEDSDRSWLGFSGNRFRMLVSRKAVYIEDNYKERPGTVVETAEMRELVSGYIEKTAHRLQTEE